MCGDDKDLIDGKPTGAVRVSLGYMSTLQDVRTCLQFLVDCFLENPHKPVFVEKILKNQSVSTGSENPVNQQKDVEVELKYSFKKLVSNDKQVESSARLSEADNQGDNVEDAVKETVDTSGKQETFHTIQEHQAEPKTMISSVVKLDNKEPIDDGGGIDRINNILVAIENPIRDQLYTNHVNDGTSDTVSAPKRMLTDIFIYPIKSCGAFKVSIVWRS